MAPGRLALRRGCSRRLARTVGTPYTAPTPFPLSHGLTPLEPPARPYLRGAADMGGGWGGRRGLSGSTERPQRSPGGGSRGNGQPSPAPTSRENGGGGGACRWPMGCANRGGGLVGCGALPIGCAAPRPVAARTWRGRARSTWATGWERSPGLAAQPARLFVCLFVLK